MQQAGYAALAVEPSFLWAFCSFRAAFLAARSANRLVVVLGGEPAPSDGWPSGRVPWLGDPCRNRCTSWASPGTAIVSPAFNGWRSSMRTYLKAEPEAGRLCTLILDRDCVTNIDWLIAYDAGPFKCRGEGAG